MRKEKIIAETILLYSGTAALSVFAAVLLTGGAASAAAGASGAAAAAAALYTAARRLRVFSAWQGILKSCCANMTFNASSFGLKKATGTMLECICRFPGIEAAWVMRRESDGFFRIFSSRGAVSYGDGGVSDIHAYFKTDPGGFGEFLITSYIPDTLSFPSRPAAILHIPLYEGELLTGVVSFSASKKKTFARYGEDMFVTVAGLIQQLYDNAARRSELEYMTRKTRNEVDSASDELTKTNLCLINRVRELKSLYNLSVRVFTARDEKDAAMEVFRQVSEILKSDAAVYFKLEDDSFRYMYSTFDSLPGDNESLSLPACFLSHNRGIVISDISDVKELEDICRRLGLSRLMVAPAKVGDEIRGLLISGTKRSADFTEGELEILTMYSSRFAEFLDRQRLTDMIMQDNFHLKELNEVKDKFIALISHELRTPLSSIRGFSEMLFRGEAGELNSEQAECLQSVINSSIKLESTINNIIDLSDFQKGRVKIDLEKTDWTAIVKKTCSGLAGEFSAKGIMLETKFDRKIGDVFTDSEKLSSALKHIISNAVKFSGTGGKISIVTRGCGDYFETIIKDSGIGVTARMQKKVFEKFVQLQDPLTRNIEGLGIGLSLAKEIIESHGGTIGLNSVAGRGTGVTIVLPRKGSAPRRDQ